RDRRRARLGPRRRPLARLRRRRGRGVPAAARRPRRRRASPGRPRPDGGLHQRRDRRPPRLRPPDRRPPARPHQAGLGIGGRLMPPDPPPTTVFTTPPTTILGTETSLPLSVVRLLNQACERFEAAWRSGTE